MASQWAVNPWPLASRFDSYHVDLTENRTGYPSEVWGVLDRSVLIVLAADTGFLIVLADS